MTKRRLAALALAAGTVAGVVAIATSLTPAASPAPKPRVIELTIHHSRFDKSVVEIARGERVEFVVHNTDPIVHELIVGSAAVQRRHEAGTEALHGPKPGEVSIPAVASASTTYRVNSPQPIQFACHLPGHFAYGMQGTVRVLDGPRPS